MYGMAGHAQAYLGLRTYRPGFHQGSQLLHKGVVDCLPVIPAAIKTQAFAEDDDGFYRLVHTDSPLRREPTGRSTGLIQMTR